MKKILKLSALLILLFILAACNVDGENGLYYQIAESSQESDTKILHYLGSDGSDYYFLGPDGIFKHTYGGSTSTLLSNETSKVIDCAYKLNADIFFLMYNGDSSIYKFTVSAKTVEKFDASVTYSKIWENGYVTSPGGLYTLTSGALSSTAYTGTTDGGSTKTRISGSSILFSDGSKTYIYNGSSLTELSTTEIVQGFQELDTSNFYVILQNKKVYKVSSGDTALGTEILTLENSYQSDGYFSAVYKSGTDVLIKTSAGYTLLTNDKWGDQSKVSFLSGITGVDAVAMEPADSTHIILATYSNGIYSLDMDGETKQSIL